MMNSAPTPHLHSTPSGFISALLLQRMATITSLGKVQENYEHELFERQVDWLTSLVNSRDERLTYDLRIIAEPNTTMYSLIAMAVLCSMSGFDETEARQHVGDLLSLSEAFFEDEYEFGLTANAEELQRFLSPFVVSSATEICRRTEMALLDTYRSTRRKPPLGFRRAHTAAIDQDQGRLYYVYPYKLNPGKMSHLFTLMADHDEPLAVSIRLQPTSLTEAEMAFLEDQIVECERSAQIVLGYPGEEPEKVFPTLQAHARGLQERFTKTLNSLKDNAALLYTSVVSPSRVSPALVEVLGAQFTEPAGGGSVGFHQEDYLSGGYDVRQLAGNELTQAGERLMSVEVRVPSDNGVPSGAERLRYLFDSREAASAFRFPIPPLKEEPGPIVKSFRTHLASSTLPTSGQLIGYSRHAGKVQPVYLSRDDRRRHVYAVGQTGTGKTTMFESMIVADMHAGEGVCVIDPHGDLIEKLLTKIPASRVNDVILFDPSDVERPIGFNMLQYRTEAQKYFLIQEILAILERLFEDKYTGSASVTGPMFYQHVRMVLLLAMNNPDNIGTLVQFHQVFNSKGFYKTFLPLKTSDPLLERFVQETLSRVEYTRPGSEGSSLGSYISSKFDQFVCDPALRNIFGQRHSTIDLQKVMNEGKILLVNLSKGRMGEVNARFLGMVLIAKLWAAAIARASMPAEQRRDFFIYVDEFQSLATLSFGTLLSEARKYRTNLILTNQYVAQVDTRITFAILGNVGTIISFRIGPMDAEVLAREYQPTFTQYDLLNLPNFTTYVTTLAGGQVSRPFSMQTIMDTTRTDPRRGFKVREHSRKRYGRNRREVEQEIEESLSIPAKPEESATPTA